MPTIYYHQIVVYLSERVTIIENDDSLSSVNNDTGFNGSREIA